MDVKFNPSNSAQLVTCGLKHIKFWNLCGNTLSSKSGILGKFGPSQSFHSLHFNRSNDVIAGAANGALYRFEKNKASSAQSVHKVTLPLCVKLIIQLKWWLYKTLEGTFLLEFVQCLNFCLKKCTTVVWTRPTSVSGCHVLFIGLGERWLCNRRQGRYGSFVGCWLQCHSQLQSYRHRARIHRYVKVK